ncbi:TPA: DUF285 domain-containing protein [Vibrio parahaemolyticus]|nr:DUF285 domain-containing protein [Vibrio parahaemolyticus]
MKKTIITLTLLATFASNAAFVSFISDSKYNIASNDPSSETGQIVGGGEYVASEPSTGGGSEPVAPSCEGPELTKRQLQDLVMSGGDYSKACVGTITDFSLVFMNRNVNYDITNWDVSSGEDFSGMFEGSSFNQDISGWNVSNGQNFGSMFMYARAFNQDISGWNVSNGTNFSSMFSATRDFNQNIGGWNVSNGRNFSYMFDNAKAFNQDISSWNVSNGNNFNRMFRSANVFNQDISGWDVTAATSWYDFNQNYPVVLVSENIPAKFR